MTTYNPIQVLGISGSLRRDSYNTALLRAAAELMPPGMTLEILNLSHLPMFNQASEKPFPDPEVELRTKLEQADALLIARPDYHPQRNGAAMGAIRRSCFGFEQTDLKAASIRSL